MSNAAYVLRVWLLPSLVYFAASVVILIAVVPPLYRALHPVPETTTMYCRTGAGPMIVEGYEIRQRINPVFSDVHELIWKVRHTDMMTSSAALQPPITCSVMERSTGIAKDVTE